MLFDIIFFGIKHQLSVKIISYEQGRFIKFQKYGKGKVYTLYFENDEVIKSESEDVLVSLLGKKN